MGTTPGKALSNKLCQGTHCCSLVGLGRVLFFSRDKESCKQIIGHPVTLVGYCKYNQKWLVRRKARTRILLAAFLLHLCKNYYKHWSQRNTHTYARTHTYTAYAITLKPYQMPRQRNTVWWQRAVIGDAAVVQTSTSNNSHCTQPQQVQPNLDTTGALRP